MGVGEDIAIALPCAMSGRGSLYGSIVRSTRAPNEPPAAVAATSASAHALATAFCNASRRAGSGFDAYRLSEPRFVEVLAGVSAARS